MSHNKAQLLKWQPTMSNNYTEQDANSHNELPIRIASIVCSEICISKNKNLFGIEKISCLK